MFDDPKKELEWLEENLLAVQSKDEDFERFYEEIYEEFGHKEPEEEEDYLKEILEDIPSLGEEGVNSHRAKARPAAAPAPVVQKKENNLPLVLLLCLECLGILGVAIWWLLRLL